MTLDEFRQSLAATESPAGLRHALAWLWWDRKGDWNRVHEAFPAIAFDDSWRYRVYLFSWQFHGRRQIRTKEAVCGWR